ncbi:uncharacterized protein LOC139917427 isoform X1 [Centroberyx gerrardi]
MQAFTAAMTTTLRGTTARPRPRPPAFATTPPAAFTPAPVLPTAPPNIRQDTTAGYNAPALPHTHSTTALPYMSENTTVHHTVAAAEDGYYLAILGGVMFGLILLCVVLLALAYMTGHKGSYRTNEADDEESVGPETALQSDAAPDTVEEEE